MNKRIIIAIALTGFGLASLVTLQLVHAPTGSSVVQLSSFGVVRINTMALYSSSMHQTFLITLSSTAGPYFLDSMQISMGLFQAQALTLIGVNIDNFNGCASQGTIIPQGQEIGELVSVVQANCKVIEPMGNLAIGATTSSPGMVLQVTICNTNPCSNFAVGTNFWVIATVTAPATATVSQTLTFL